MNKNAKYINNTLCLRQPQSESLEVFEKICNVLKLQKEVDLEEELTKVKELCPTLTSFEREFPSLCFALATGIGKTRLMGAFLAYLYYQKGVKNFFVMAPNLTIYNKLKADFGNNSNPKYVFKGLDAFVNPPRIIDGENYGEYRQGTFGYNEITINIFNISKLNSDSKTADGKPARIKRLNEVLGESYFEYLKSLPDLCILMDESHHYHADKSFEVINELHPILGVELTATPQIQKGAKATLFKNVVYEYSLARALKDEKYIKVPAVFTRKDFHTEEFSPEDLDKEKLKDGIKLHIDTKEVLDTYARTHGIPIVKPFVLVVAKDTDHSKQIRNYLTSTDFYKGYYKNKVLEINSTQRGMEKDENIAQLLTLENPDNKVEIVIHVNMLKEGWDVNNLYTIIPLRASASETLTEQTIGRGLRLPYGERTKNEKVDRLSIVSHDKYEAIIKLAEDPNSLVRKVYFIDPENSNEDQKETIELPSKMDELMTDPSLTQQLTLLFSDDLMAPAETKLDIAKFVSEITFASVMEMNKHVKNIEEMKQPQMQKILHKSIVFLTKKEFPTLNLKESDVTLVVQKAVENCVQALTSVVIPIPQTIIQPVMEIKQGFYEFQLNTKNMNWHPSDDILIGTELQEEGKTFDIDLAFAQVKETDTPENAIIKHLLVHENVDYEQCADLLYALVNQLKQHFQTYLNQDEVHKVLIQRRKSIADNIYAQMNEHFYKEEITYAAAAMRPFSKIEAGFGGKYISDAIYDLKANIPPQEIKSKIFKGFKKSCHSLYKFDSNTEKTFAMILENDSSVLKWMCPNIKQFNIYYDRDIYNPKDILHLYA
ncbi:MAG: DEAD/DEAH box helicase family protein [Desulfitobacteriaceae bacterium]